MDKSDLIEKVLDQYGVRFRAERSGWQSIQCPNEMGHAHGDRNPSARLNMTLGLMRCLGCDLSGDGYNVIMHIEGVNFLKAKSILGGVEQRKDAEWLI